MRLLMIRCRTREEGTSILARISKGEDFAAIVRSLAGPDGGGPKGFDLGPVRPDDLKPPLNAAAAKLQPGRSSPLIELADGFVILKRNP